jgi:diguanylate cyclase (GGDEF)-like protein
MLIHQALHDPLTGLPNRLLLADRIERAYAWRGRHARPNCLFYLDLNGFKAVNDRFGHATGDRVLQLLAKRLVALLRPQDTAARLGGDEFAVLCVDVQPQHCAQVAERLRAAASAPFVIDDRSIEISAAVGTVATHAFGPAIRNATGLLHQADRRMYEQKRRPSAP